MAALLFGLLILTGPELAFADEASPEEQPLEAEADEQEPLEAAADEADPLDANSGGTVNVYRLYNRSTSEHLYTTSRTEYDSLPSKGPWTQEGVAWVAPKKSSTPVYRLYNKKLGDHHYTTSKGERDALTRSGWRYEGVAFYSDDSHRVPLYRVYNGRLKAGQHHYTTSKGERDSLVRNSGWRNEGIGFYAIKKGTPAAKPADLSRYRIVYVPQMSFELSSLSASEKSLLLYMLQRLEALGKIRADVTEIMITSTNRGIRIATAETGAMLHNYRIDETTRAIYQDGYGNGDFRKIDG